MLYLDQQMGSDIPPLKHTKASKPEEITIDDIKSEHPTLFGSMGSTIPFVISSGKQPIGSGTWMMLNNWKTNCRTRDEVFPPPTGRCFGDAYWKEAGVLLQRFRNEDRADEAYTRVAMYTFLEACMDVPWHEWMCQIGPVLHGVGYKSSNLYMQFSVCWGDILGAINVPQYMDGYLVFYKFLVDVHKLRVPIMACCDVHMMVMRWIHVIASIGIHIQVLEKTNKCIGGN